MIRKALEYIAGLAAANEKTEVLEINGRTYANRRLERYDGPEYARPMQASTLTALVDYIGSCMEEFRGDMLVHVVSPTKVRLLSMLDKERNRETLFEVEAEVSAFRFGSWYDQEQFMIALQANFQKSEDLDLVMKVAGNTERKNEQQFTDDGRSQVVTMQVGVASKADALVPNPVKLVPYRTFQEVEQPESQFVFRIGDDHGPQFKIVEAEGGIWKNQAVGNIKCYLAESLAKMDESIASRITVIG